MALPQDGQDANGLTKVTQIPAGKELMFIDPTTNEGGIITLEDLTKQILNGLASQAFALDVGQMTLLAALNKLNSDTFRAFNLTSYDAISTDLKSFNYGIARYAHIANDAPSDDNGFLISLYRSENARAQIALSDLGNLYVRTANSAESFNEWIVYNKI